MTSTPAGLKKMLIEFDCLNKFIYVINKTAILTTYVIITTTILYQVFLTLIIVPVYCFLLQKIIIDK